MLANARLTDGKTVIMVVCNGLRIRLSWSKREPPDDHQQPRESALGDTVNTHVVRIEQTGDEFECAEDETVLAAAFRSGYNLASGCREGRCSACKSYVLEGYTDHKPHSTFALSESEEEQGFALLCRAMPESDLCVELLHFDAESYKLERPIVEGLGRVTTIEPLTHDITSLTLEIAQPADFGFKAGQYLDLWIPGADEKRSYSMANLSDTGELEFIMKRYPGGRFSRLLDGTLQVGDEMKFTGPYGNCCLRASSADRRQLLVAGGSGMAPILSLLRQIASDGAGRTVRFFYGGREQHDLFHTDLIEELGSQIEDFQYIPVLSQLADDDGSWTGERGFVHQAVARSFEDSAPDPSNWEAYVAGPQVMVDAALELLSGSRWIDTDNIFYDTFTDTGAVSQEEVA
jgi:propane monooxygenase reductase subunit